ncbi:MAG: 5-deoxy-glucuronate isomerase [Firmicutes bacterium]|nr:5-deoxy-glucuronate isomerase [Bacillota bacterium]
MYHLRAKGPFRWGYTTVTTEDEAQANTMMDFGFLRLKAGEVYEEKSPKETAFLLMSGSVTLSLNGKKHKANRQSLFHEDPSCLHLPPNVALKITAHSDTELNITRTSGDVEFAPRFYSPSDIRSEERGKGTMQETSTRIVRTVFDKSNAPYSNLVVGEVVDFPGKWSSYPPHHHPQPEIYHYRFLPENGFGVGIIGDEAYVLTDHDSVKILDSRIHPQVTAPGYAMYYIWVIRHLDGNPYGVPTFVPEHKWVMEEGASMFPERSEADE